MANDEEMLIPKERQLFSESILPENKDEIAKVMDNPMEAVIQAYTGLAIEAAASSSMSAALKPRIGKLLQGALAGKIYREFDRQIKELRDKGKIVEDYTYEKNEYGSRSLADICSVIDKEAPEKEKLEALIGLFFVINKLTATDAEKLANYRLLQIALRLKSSELVLLKKIYSQFESNTRESDTKLTEWARQVAKTYGNDYPAALVLQDEKALVNEGLLSGHDDATVTEVRQTVNTYNARLTDLGILFCQNLEKCVREAQAAQDNERG